VEECFFLLFEQLQLWPTTLLSTFSFYHPEVTGRESTLFLKAFSENKIKAKLTDGHKSG